MRISVPAVFLLSLSLLASSCVTIPEAPYVVSRRGGAEDVAREALCRDDGSESPVLPGEGSREGIDPDGFTLFSWS